MRNQLADGRFRYGSGGEWLKGNTHIHSTASDGGRNVAELTEMYAGAGYDFLFRTDHWVAAAAGAQPAHAPLLWLDGLELDGADETGAAYHVVCLGTFSGIGRDLGFPAALEAARAQGGLLILAHPFWTGNNLEDAVRWSFHGVEIYNHVCHWLNGKSDGAVHWHRMLEANPQTLAFAADDAHICPEHPGWDGGWIMVNAQSRTPAAILRAIRAGRYYSTCGPRFEELAFDGQNVGVRTSPVRFTRLVSAGWHGKRSGNFDGQLHTQASFAVPPEWPYVCLEIEDEWGRRAWTNTLFR